MLKLFEKSKKAKKQEASAEIEVNALGEESILAKSSYEKMFWIGGCIVVVGLIGFLQYKALTKKKESKVEAEQVLKLEVAEKVLDAEKMWRNHFEEKLTEKEKKTEKAIELIESSMNEQARQQNDQLKAEVEKLRGQLQYLIEEQNITRREIASAREKNEEPQQIQELKLIESKLNVNNLDRKESFDRPKSMKSYIPETSYIKGVLLGGIVVSTSIGSSSEPVPVVIRITDKGNLPKDFTIDLSKCRLLGSSYGDLSSERAIIRAETLSCSDEVRGLIYTTKVAGVIFGDDGLNGIKGKVVQASSKHMKNAIVGSMISGFASVAKGQDSYSISGSGVISNKSKGIGDLAKEGGLSGASNAAEKIADYYIKQAESMSPILIIPGGVKVDIVFTKGVYFGEIDVAEKLARARSDNR